MAKKEEGGPLMICGTPFEVEAKYHIIKPIGQGAYGVVWY